MALVRHALHLLGDAGIDQGRHHRADHAAAAAHAGGEPVRHESGGAYCLEHLFACLRRDEVGIGKHARDTVIGATPTRFAISRTPSRGDCGFAARCFPLAMNPLAPVAAGFSRIYQATLQTQTRGDRGPEHGSPFDSLEIPMACVYSNPKETPMPITLYGFKSCDTVKKARKWLESRGVEHEFFDYRVKPLDAGTVDGSFSRAGWEAVFNRNSTTFKELPDAERASIDAAKARKMILAETNLITSVR